MSEFNDVSTISVGVEAVPYLRALVMAMRNGRDRFFDEAAIDWAEFLAECLENL